MAKMRDVLRKPADPSDDPFQLEESALRLHHLDRDLCRDQIKLEQSFRNMPGGLQWKPLAPAELEAAALRAICGDTYEGGASPYENIRRRRQIGERAIDLARSKAVTGFVRRAVSQSEKRAAEYREAVRKLVMACASVQRANRELAALKDDICGKPGSITFPLDGVTAPEHLLSKGMPPHMHSAKTEHSVYVFQLYVAAERAGIVTRRELNQALGNDIDQEFIP